MEHTEYPGKPFYNINQPPDLYKETEWPKFAREPWFWAVVEENKTMRISFGDLPPRRTAWELQNCNRGEKVLLRIYYPEPLRIQVWLDPENNETGRTPTSEAPIDINADHSQNYFEDGETRIMNIVMQCGKGFEIHQLMVVRVQMRLDITMEEFDEQSSKTFARNIANLLGVPQDRVRIVEVTAGSLIVNFVIEAEDSQSYNIEAQEAQLNFLAETLQNMSAEALQSQLGVQAELLSLYLSGFNYSACGANGNGSGCTVYDEFSSQSFDAWKVVLIIFGGLLFIAAISAVSLVLLRRGSSPSAIEESKEMGDKKPEADEDIFKDEDEFPDYIPKQFNPGLTGDHAPQDPYSPKMVIPEMKPKLKNIKINLEYVLGGLNKKV